MSINRSKDVIENPNIHKCNLTIGPMAISGSTRMRASTVLMLAIGMGLLYEHKNEKDFNSFYADFLKRLSQTSYQKMASLTDLEAKLYKNNKYLNYITDPNLAISILTDTTERSPTFSLKGFENRLDQDRLHGLDISLEGLKTRKSKIPCEEFFVHYQEGRVLFKCLSQEVIFHWGDDLHFNHLMAKMLLNAHSTLIMGLLGRYQGNVMTWVRSSNNKLIDRVARYITQLLKQKNKTPSYDEVVLKIFEEIENVNENEPVVVRVMFLFGKNTIEVGQFKTFYLCRLLLDLS